MDRLVGISLWGFGHWKLVDGQTNFQCWLWQVASLTRAVQTVYNDPDVTVFGTGMVAFNRRPLPNNKYPSRHTPSDWIFG